MLMRRLWTGDEKVGWDDAVPAGIGLDWRQLRVDLEEIQNITFKSCIKPKEATGNPSLRVFSDGSQRAYVTVAYARWETQNGKFVACIIASKNTIAPAKTIGVVRLELAGAVIGKRLRVFIEKEMNYTFDIVGHILDSEVVKVMMQKQSYGFNTYVANRRGEIHQGTKEEEWYWLPGKPNIAD